MRSSDFIAFGELLSAKPSLTASAFAPDAGFAAWLRSRGEVGASIFTADSVAEQYGVVASSYTAVPLAAADVHAVRCTGAGKPKDVLQLSMEALPPALEWGEVSRRSESLQGLLLTKRCLFS